MTILKIHYRKNHYCCEIWSVTPSKEHRLGADIKGTGSGILCCFWNSREAQKQCNPTQTEGAGEQAAENNVWTCNRRSRRMEKVAVQETS
jgi:hypothetical protein